ncbi:MAG: DsrE family protein, partial [Bacteroidota bacterium]
HGPMTYTLMNNQAYKEKFSVDNPNIELIKALKKANVKITVCGQSMIGRDVGHDQLLDEVEVATSMLTTVTTYQLKGYAMLKF